MTPDQIKALRHRLGLSTMAFAIRLNVSVDTVRSWEQGVRRPRPEILSLLVALDASTAIVGKATA
jgi:DNA-binding transcriptional regulator YiaG